MEIEKVNEEYDEANYNVEVRDKNEKWIDGCKVYVGIPPIQRGLPSDLIYEIFGTQHHKFHLEEEFWDCY